MSDLPRLLRAIATSDYQEAVTLLDATPSLVTAGVDRRDEFFLAECLAQVYEGDTALQAAAFSYDAEMARKLVSRGADVRARNRRGAEPLHAAVIGEPGSAHWNPTRQQAVILCLIEAGADPNATAAGGVTPLHRAVRNRCSTAVEVLLRTGADPRLGNDRVRPPPISPTGRRDAAARARPRPKPNNASSSSCSSERPRDGQIHCRLQPSSCRMQ